MSDYKEPFSYDGYQIVRREMFAHLREPAVVIRKDSVTFNTACLNGLEDTIYIHILIDAKAHRIAVRKCDKNDRDAQRWCVAKPDKRKTRKITSRYFTQMLYDLMRWSDKCRYKVEGERKELISGETAYVFDLDKNQVIYERKKKTKEEILSEKSALDVSAEEREQRLAEERMMDSKPFYPDDMENSYGVPVKQQGGDGYGAHEQSG